jgi:hypothetical protein
MPVMKNNILCILGLLVLSCETNWGKFGNYKIEYDSALEYYLVLNKIDTVLENYPYYNKGAFIKFYKNDSIIDTNFVAFEGTIVSSHISDDNVVSDDKFILIAQKPLNKICECNDVCLDKKYPNQKISSYLKCKKALEESNYFEYWIINKELDIVYGPLTKYSYLKKCKELMIPKNLEMKLLM